MYRFSWYDFNDETSDRDNLGEPTETIDLSSPGVVKAFASAFITEGMEEVRQWTCSRPPAPWPDGPYDQRDREAWERYDVERKRKLLAHEEPVPGTENAITLALAAIEKGSHFTVYFVTKALRMEPVDAV